ncbi:hypothetical protein CKN80_03795 [Carnobacterium divergens]|uniref:hypothetical protein n=1 Tax=Carnobacterium divergens TaxID=2748 RepID=UPI001071AD32|nr:hypothetical protein [Carnobacterium divergens]TFJ46870.1 hypothetical protein CKN79_03790 [Carnobacterium divergens]TFJ53834.1 hypothetical protein CKN80_03795 [Carnobacterium divergens]
MTKINLEPWNTTSYPTGTYELEKILYNRDGTKIELANNNCIVTIHFPKPIEFLRTSDEGNRIRTTHDILAEYGETIFREHTIFKILNSELSAWLENETFTILNQENFTHFLIATNNDITEIVSFNEPLISFETK